MNQSRARTPAMLLALACLVARAPEVRAERPGELHVSLRVDPCLGVAEAEVRRLLAIELDAPVPATADPRDPGAVWIDAACGDRAIELTVRDPVTGKSLSRRIANDDIPRRGRERLLALAAMELMVASWVELEVTPAPSVPALDRSAAGAPQRSARAIVRRRYTPWRSTTSIAGRVARVGAAWSAGGGVRLAIARDWFAVGLDVVADRGTIPVSAGDVTATRMQLGVFAELARAAGPVTLGAGAGSRIGIASLRGRAAAPMDTAEGTVSGPSGGPYAMASVAIAVGGLELRLDVEAGWVVLPVRGMVDGREEASVDGAWLGSNLALGWRW